MTVLSVIVATIPGRESLLSRCLASITVQDGDYEVIVLPGTAGLGTKYVAGVKASTADYVTNIDDDDYVTDRYMAEVLPLCDGVDYVGLQMEATVEGRPWHTRMTTGAVKAWDDTPTDDGYMPLCPVPKGVLRRDIAVIVRYGDAYGDDRPWAARVSELVDTYHDIDQPIYRYDYWPHRFGLRSGGRDVGMFEFDESKIRWLEVNR